VRLDAYHSSEAPKPRLALRCRRSTPYMLRHSCGFYLANGGYDLGLIQDYLGHRDPKHTVRYTRIVAIASKDSGKLAIMGARKTVNQSREGSVATAWARQGIPVGGRQGAVDGRVPVAALRRRDHSPGGSLVLPLRHQLPRARGVRSTRLGTAAGCRSPGGSTRPT
jgi:hypothetical protein